MGSFGERLRREREMRGIGLDEIAAATKISTRNLRALEEEKFDQLPGGIFNKGFVRAYAKFLGIDEEQVVGEYEAASHETEVAREQKLQEEFAKAEFRKESKREDQEISLEPKSQWGTIAVIVLIAALAYVGYSYYQRRKLDRQQAHTSPAVTAPASPVQASPPPLTTSASTPSVTGAPAETASSADATKTSDSGKSLVNKPAGQAATSSPNTPSDQGSLVVQSPIDVSIKVNQPAWVSVTVDGKNLVSTTLSPGTERSFKASQKIEMVVGNTSGVEISYNGKPVPNLSTSQDVRRLTFTPSGYE